MSRRPDRNMTQRAVQLYAAVATAVVLYQMYSNSKRQADVDDCRNRIGLVAKIAKQSECFASDARMRVPNMLRTKYDTFASEKLGSLSARNATSEDGEVIELVRHLLDLPSRHMRKAPANVSPSPQARVIDALFKQKTGGFFVEAGAYDGMESSNSLFLEHHRQWTGLLVETDPYFYTQIIGRSRSAWTINAAISTVPYVTQMDYDESYSQFGKLLPASTTSAMKLPCFPLYAMLLALNRTTVDYFSLDVEGLEFDVLKTLPFNKVKFGAISVEYVHSAHSKQAFIDYMAQYGYIVHKDLIVRQDLPFEFAHDLIFIPKQQ